MLQNETRIDIINMGSENQCINLDIKYRSSCNGSQIPKKVANLKKKFYTAGSNTARVLAGIRLPTTVNAQGRRVVQQTVPATCQQAANVRAAVLPVDRCVGGSRGGGVFGGQFGEQGSWGVEDSAFAHHYLNYSDCLFKLSISTKYSLRFGILVYNIF